MATATSFFRQGNARCPMYSRARDLQDEQHTMGREFLEQLWRECGRFLDRNAARRAMENLSSVFWELYLAYALRRSGINIVEQNRSKKVQKGPDLRAVDPEVWIEAVVANAGTGADALQPPPIGVTYSVPVEAFILRLRNAIKTKANIIEGYIQDKIIRQDQAAVIAISGCMLYTQFTEHPIPRIIRAALGVGNLVVEIDRSTGVSSGYSLEYDDKVQKANGAPVKTDIFLGSAYSHVSALIYSPSDWVNRPLCPGKEFILIHNENARVKLPRGWLSSGVEYWLDGTRLRSVDHAAADVSAA